jgi:hypothetical protein
MDRKNTNCRVCRVQHATEVVCPPYEAPLMDLMKHPYMSPIGHEDSKDEESLADAKTVVAKTSKDKNCFGCRKCTVSGYTQNCCTYKRIPLKKKERCMIGIPPEDGDDDTEVEFEDGMKVPQTEVGDVTPRMDLENEAVSPWSIQSPETKRLRIQEEMRQEEFNKKWTGSLMRKDCAWT